MGTRLELVPDQFPRCLAEEVGDLYDMAPADVFQHLFDRWRADEFDTAPTETVRKTLGDLMHLLAGFGIVQPPG